MRAAAARQKEADLQKSLEETQETLRRTTGDYLQLRRVHQREQRRTHEETAALRSRNQQLVSELERMRQAAVEDAEVRVAASLPLWRPTTPGSQPLPTLLFPGLWTPQNVRRAAQQQSEEYASQFRRQAKEREEDLIVLKEQYGTMQAEYERRTETMHEKLRKLQSRYKALQQRRNLEFEGFNNDFRTLRQQARRMEAALTSKDFPRTAGARAMLHAAAEGPWLAASPPPAASPAAAGSDMPRRHHAVAPRGGGAVAPRDSGKPESSRELQSELERLRVGSAPPTPPHRPSSCGCLLVLHLFLRAVPPVLAGARDFGKRTGWGAWRVARRRSGVVPVGLCRTE